MYFLVSFGDSVVYNVFGLESMFILFGDKPNSGYFLLGLLILIWCFFYIANPPEPDDEDEESIFTKPKPRMKEKPSWWLSWKDRG